MDLGRWLAHHLSNWGLLLGALKGILPGVLLDFSVDSAYLLLQLLFPVLLIHSLRELLDQLRVIRVERVVLQLLIQLPKNLL